MELPEDKRQAILEAVYGARKIEAIKFVREATNCGLKEAKEFVEKLSAELYAKEPEKFTAAPGKSGCVGMILAVAAILAAACVVIVMLVR